jgi:hypothetical protein
MIYGHYESYLKIDNLISKFRRHGSCGSFPLFSLFPKLIKGLVITQGFRGLKCHLSYCLTHRC